MKTNLSCSVVRDLLPSYIEGLTEKQTSDAVKEHLDCCESCKEYYESMAQGEDIANQNETKQVDFLKKVRKGNIKKIVLAVAASVLVFAIVILSGSFIYVRKNGYFKEIEANQEDIIIKTSISDNMFLGIELQPKYSNYVISDIGKTKKDGVVTISAKIRRAALTDENRDIWGAGVELDGVKQVKLFDYVIWHDGHLIDVNTNEIFASKIPYIGDAPSFIALIEKINFGSSFTIKLQTSKEPYSATLNFNHILNKKTRDEAQKKAVLALALVDNLGEISWTDPSGYKDTLTLEQANKEIPENIKQYNVIYKTDFKAKKSIKDYSKNIYDFYILKEMVGI